MSLHVQRFADRTITRDLRALPQCISGEADLRPYAGLIPFLKEIRDLTEAEREDMPVLIGAAMWRLSNGLGLCLSHRGSNLQLSIAFKDRTLTLTTPDPFIISTSNRRADAGLATSLIGCIDLALLLLEAGQAEPSALRDLQREYEERRDAIALHVKTVNSVKINSVTVLPPRPVSDEISINASSADIDQFAQVETKPEHDAWMPIRVLPYTCESTAAELKLELRPYPVNVAVDFDQDPVSMLRMVARANRIDLSDAAPLIVPEIEWEYTW